VRNATRLGDCALGEHGPLTHDDWRGIARTAWSILQNVQASASGVELVQHSTFFTTMEQDDDEDSIGTKLRRIEAAQKHRSQDSDDDSASDDDEDRAVLRGPSNMSQSSVLGTSEVLESTVAEFTATGHYGASSLAVSAENGNLYLQDPFCEFAARARAPPPSKRFAGTSSTAGSRAPSPAAAPTKKKSGKKTPEEKAEEDKLQQDIDTVVNTFRVEFREYIQCEEERDVKNLEDKEYYNVAQWLKVNKPTPRKLDLSLFNSKQMPSNVELRAVGL
jgi:hypothetical protein